MTNADSLSYASIDELGRQLRSGAISSAALVGHFLARLESVGRGLNAVVTISADRAWIEAAQADRELAAGHDRGPLHGIPYGAKDLLAMTGIPTTCGAAPFRDQVVAHDAAVIEKLREAGAVLVAKLAMVELAGGFGYDQPDAAFTGPGLNPWNTDAWAGGSSSGSAATVAAGCVPFAIGSETFGSITLPASFCGIAGLRPTFGRVSRRGAMALSWSMDKLGPMARSARDCDLILDAIAGHDPDDPSSLISPAAWSISGRSRYRIAVLRDAAVNSQPDIGACFEKSLDVLREFADLDEVALPDYPYGVVGEQVITAEAASAFEDLFSSGRAKNLTAPEDRHGLADGLTMPAIDYLRAMRIRRLAARDVDRTLTGFDAIVAPTTRVVANPIALRFNDYFAAHDGPSLGGAGNICGLPAISIPNGFGERGLPTGLEIASRAWNDAAVLAIAAACQARTDWHLQRPPAL